MSFYRFRNEDGEEYGSFEVFCMDESYPVEPGVEPWEPGYYWQACFPGCLPDGEPVGPFDSEDEAIEAARDE